MLSPDCDRGHYMIRNYRIVKDKKASVDAGTIANLYNHGAESLKANILKDNSSAPVSVNTSPR
jgi:hypothetical protein